MVDLCEHKNKMVLKSWRPNVRYGKFKAIGKPRSHTLVCVKCGVKLERWKIR